MSRRVMTFRPINSFSAESSRQRVRRSLREQGLARTALALGLSARWRLRLFDEDFRARRFDRRLGVDTRGIVRHDPDNEELRGVRHAQSVRERDFRAAFAHVDVDRERTLFLDLGCGKGKALLLAREAGFRRVLGVELSEEIADIATRNVERTAGTVVVADATRFEFPPDPTVLFLYNPFDQATLRTVLENLEDSLRAAPRRIVIAYVYPLDAAPCDERSWLREVHRARRHVIYESVGSS